MKSRKIAYLFIISLVLLASGFAFFSILGRDMIANIFIENAINQKDETAIKYYNTALKISPENATARNKLASIYIKNDDLDLALAEINQGIKENPNNDDLYFYKVKIYESLENIEKAIDTVFEIESSYVKNKFNAKSDYEPIFNIKSGYYTQNIEITLSNPAKSTIYYKINAGKYEKYEKPIFLQDGFYDITAVTISELGVVSREILNEYKIENLVTPVAFTSKDNIKVIENQLENGMTANKEGLLSITKLDLSECIIFDSDIETLLNCTNLETLILGDITNISTFYPLSKLDFLTTIYVKQGCTKTLFEEILKITTLKTIEISNSRINILPKNTTQLTSLTLKNCLIYDIENILDYKTLETLNLSQNLITDITQISNLKKLSNLNLANNKIDDISAITDIISIKKLDLSNNKIVKITKLSNLTFLETVNISNNEIASVLEFSNLRYLTILNCAYNNLKTLEPLTKSTSLQEIYANDNYIEDVSYLENFENLSYINISNNMI